MSLSKNKNILIVTMLLLGVVTFLIYSPSINGDFVYDDHEYITDNYTVKNLSVENLGEIWSSFTFGNYNPLTITSFSLDYYLFTGNTTGYHIVNIVLQYLICILVFFFSYKLTKSFWGSLLATFIFVVHPLHVESVSWISGRKDVLYALFFLLSLIFYLKYIESDEKRNIGLTYLFFILSCLSKPMAVIRPLVLLLVDYSSGRKIDKQAIVEKIPFFAISIIFGILTIIGQGTTSSIRIQEQYNVLDKIILSFYTITFYIEKLLLPVNLSANYPFPVKADGFFPARFYESVIFVVIISFLVFKKRKSKKVIFAFLFFIVSILPVMQIVAVGNAITADRFAYMASVPFVLLFAFLVKSLFSENSKLKTFKNYIVGAVIVWGLWMAYTTYSRASVWQNAFTLFEDMIEKNPQTAFAYNNLGLAYLEERKDYDKAVKLFKQAVSIKPNYSMAFNNLGNAYDALGQNEEALIAYRNSVMSDSTNASALNNLGLEYYKIDKYDNAEKSYQKALNLNSNYFDALNNYGNLLTAKGDFERAFEMFDKAKNIEPNNPNTSINLAGLYFEKGDIEKAKSLLDNALKIDPENEEAKRYLELINKGNSIAPPAPVEKGQYDELLVKADEYMSQNNFKKAIEIYLVALKTDPFNSKATINIAISYAGMENYQEAIKYFVKAGDIQPDNPDIYKNLAVVYYKTGNNKKLVQSYQKAAQLGDDPAKEWLRANGLNW